MRKAILGAASAIAVVSPALAADLPPRYSEVSSYEPEVRTYGYRTAPPVIVGEPVIVARPPVVVDEYPIYAGPRVYAAPPVYAYAHPVWRNRWGHRGHYRGRW
jgi:hypothetical protein